MSKEKTKKLSKKLAKKVNKLKESLKNENISMEDQISGCAELICHIYGPMASSFSIHLDAFNSLFSKELTSKHKIMFAKEMINHAYIVVFNSYGADFIHFSLIHSLKDVSEDLFERIELMGEDFMGDNLNRISRHSIH